MEVGLGWVELRLSRIARLDVNCLKTETSLKGYRKVLGEEVCIFGNSPILVIEQGTEDIWKQDALEQAKGIGKQRRYAICAAQSDDIGNYSRQAAAFR